MEPSVLIVDDDVDTCDNVSDILTDLGYRTDTAHNGQDALGLLQQTPYDVALLDFKMPGMDGLTLYREIKRLRPGTVAFLVTAFAGGDTAEAAQKAGVRDVVRKPVVFPKLLTLIDETLSHPLLLMVDDDPEFCESMWQLLTERSYRVCLAHSQQEARERLLSRAHNIVLIDLKLPDGDGSNVFQLAKATMPKARTVLITGYRSEMEQTIQKLLDSGADAVFYKPLDVGNLLEKLEQLA